ncbi:MAG: cobalamin biosynthesis protein CobD [Elusimicrobia bacterium]|nr:cobalamin biosynthesis protein CobD [Elusimicrobiota bacterium]
MESLNILLAYFLDLGLGDPRWLPHPVKIIGKLINFLEVKLGSGQPRIFLRFKGVILALAVVGLSALSAYLILAVMRKINLAAGTVAWIFLAYTSLATKDLLLHAGQVLKEINNKDLSAARKQLSYLVGRDTLHLSEKEVIKAAVESIAESASDGIIAPLFYLILGGPVLALTYKAINTLDSMVGYKNEKYQDFGWFSARLDDVANFIPSRISGLLIAISSIIRGQDFKNSFRIMIKDGRKHLSPNAGFPEASMAGALGVKLGGPAIYHGQLCLKPYIGEEKNNLQPQLINEALSITFISSLLMVLIGAGLRWLI